MALKAILDSIDDLPEDVKKEYVERNGKFELQVEIATDVGVKSFTDFSKLNGALLKERNDHKAVKERLGLLGDRKIEDVLTQLDRIPELEAAAAGKLDETKLNELVEGRLRTRIAPLERERDTLKTQLGERDKAIDSYTAKERTRTIHDEVRRAIGAQSGFQSSAVEDALMYAERMLEVTDEGRVITRDGVGITPGVDATVWLTDMQRNRPHWWGPSIGGGARGGNGGGGGSNPWTAENWNMTEQGRIYRENPSQAEQLAKVAGTTIGGQKPQPRK